MPNPKENKGTGDTKQNTDELMDGPVHPRPDVSWSDRKVNQSRQAKTENNPQ